MYVAYMFALIVCYNGKVIYGEGVCGDGWDLFHDDIYDICYKYISDGLGDYQTVVTGCRSEMDSTLPTINSKSEQDFINNLIVKYKMVENVWLDAGIKNKHIVWTDSSNGEYENWMTGHPVDDSNCVEMIHDQANMGEWQDIPCNKKNAFLCKRVVIWSAQRMERLIRDNRRLILNNAKHLNDAMTAIVELAYNQVPIGFIYVQMPDQAEPKTLWPAYTWLEVTATYAGQFFRAEGNGSLAFGQGVQAENAPRLSQVHAEFYDEALLDLTLVPGEWSPFIFSGKGEKLMLTHRFLVSGGDVRPKNQAVRLFKRSK